MVPAKRVGMAIAAAVALPLLWGGALFGLILAAAAGAGGGCGGAGGGGIGGGAAALGGQRFSAEQTSNAATITAAAAAAGLPQRAAVIGVATAIVESGLRNLSYGDRDSLGLFQQRPSQGWGPPAQVLNPSAAAATFYSRLAAVPGWAQLPPGVAAQQVQRSGFPDRYGVQEAVAAALVAKFWTGPPPGSTILAGGPAGGSPAAGAGSGSPAAGPGAGGAAAFTPGCPDQGGSNLPLGPGGLTPGGLPPGGGPDRTGAALGGLPAGFALPSDPGQAAVVRFAAAQIGKPYVWGAEGPNGFDCSGLVQAAYAAAGVPVSRTTATQVHDGTPVPGPSALSPGDLLFIPGATGTATNPGHVGIYAGHGVVIDAYDDSKGVIVESLAAWSNKIVAIRHVTGPTAAAGSVA